MDGEPPPTPFNPEEGENNSQEEAVSVVGVELSGPQKELIDEVLANGVFRAETWSTSLGEVRGRGNILPIDRKDARDKYTQLNNPAMNKLFSSGAVENSIPRMLISTPFDSRAGNNFFQRVSVPQGEEAEFIKQSPMAEVVYMGPVTDQDVMQKTETQKETYWGKNLLGREVQKQREVEVTKRAVVPGSKHKVPFDQFVQSASVPGSGEAAVALHYLLYTRHLEDMKDFKAPLVYKDRAGRPGNYFSVTACIPESVGIKLQEALKENPLLIRDVVKEIGDKKFGLEREDRKRKYTPLPYEEMNGKGLKMYMALDVGKPIEMEKEKPHAFNPANIVEVDSGAFLGE